MNEVRVNRKAADRVASGHPWIFSSDVADRGGAQPGEAVKVADPRGRPLGTAHYSSTSQITSAPALAAGRRRSAAISSCAACAPPKQHRRPWSATSDAYRVVHGEADLLPGPDRRPLRRLPRRADARPGHGRRQDRDRRPAWKRSSSRKGIVARNDVAVRAKEQLPLETTVLAGEVPESVTRPDERPHPARRPAARPEDRHLPRPARELPAPPPATPAAARRSTASPPPAASPCTWPRKCEPVEAVDSSGPRARHRARQRRSQRHRQHRVPRSRRLRSAGRLRLARAASFRWSCSIRRPSPRSRQQPGSRRPRLQGDQPARAAPAGARRHPGHLLLLPSSERSRCSSNWSPKPRSTPTARCASSSAAPRAQDHPILLTVPETHYLKCLILEVV